MNGKPAAMDSSSSKGAIRMDIRDRIYKVWQQAVRREKHRRHRLWWTWIAVGLLALLMVALVYCRRQSNPVTSDIRSPKIQRNSESLYFDTTR
jgi:type VI protein secretion system component VasF